MTPKLREQNTEAPGSKADQNPKLLTLEEIGQELERRRKVTPEGVNFEPMFSDEKIAHMDESLKHIRLELIQKFATQYKVSREEIAACLPAVPTDAEIKSMYEARLRQKAMAKSESGFGKWIQKIEAT